MELGENCLRHLDVHLEQMRQKSVICNIRRTHDEDVSSDVKLYGFCFMILLVLPVSTLKRESEQNLLILQLQRFHEVRGLFSSSWNHDFLT